MPWEFVWKFELKFTINIVKSHIDNKIIENRNASRRRTLYFLCVLVCNVIHDKMHELKSFWIVSKCTYQKKKIIIVFIENEMGIRWVHLMKLKWITRVLTRVCFHALYYSIYIYIYLMCSCWCWSCRDNAYIYINSYGNWDEWPIVHHSISLAQWRCTLLLGFRSVHSFD